MNSVSVAQPNERLFLVDLMDTVFAASCHLWTFRNINKFSSVKDQKCGVVMYCKFLDQIKVLRREFRKQFW